MSTGAVLDTIIVENNQAYPSTVYTSPDLGYYTELLKTANAYDALFRLNSTAATNAATAAAATASSGTVTADLRVAAPAGSGTGATDFQPMVVKASDRAAQRIIDQAQHSLIREWIVRPDVRRLKVSTKWVIKKWECVPARRTGHARSTPRARQPPVARSVHVCVINRPLWCTFGLTCPGVRVRVRGGCDVARARTLPSRRCKVVWGRYGVPPDEYGTSLSDGFQPLRRVPGERQLGRDRRNRVGVSGHGVASCRPTGNTWSGTTEGSGTAEP